VALIERDYARLKEFFTYGVGDVVRIKPERSDSPAEKKIFYY